MRFRHRLSRLSGPERLIPRFGVAQISGNDDIFSGIRPAAPLPASNKKEFLMKRSILTLALAGLVGFGLTARAEDPKPKPNTVSETTVVKVTILDINKAKMEVTVKDESGDVSVVAVGGTYKLDKVKVGDVVSLTLSESLTVALAKPGETDTVAAKRTAGGGAGFVTRVVTITALDMSAPSVTFVNADGKSRTVKIRNVKNAEGYKVGDKVAITYTGSLEAAIQK
jgi:hypothetical protein